MFDADRPIQKSEQDRLGRTVFAKSLARSILDHKNTESLVIGLYGGWGSGKTSIINLTLEELQYASGNMPDDERPIILNFSPWSYSGQDQLVYSFFRRLSSEMRHADYFKNSEKIIHLLELYVSFFTHKPVPKSLRPKHNWVSQSLKPQRTREETYGWESGRDLTLVKSELNELLKQQKHKLIIFIDNIPRLTDSEMNQIFQIVKSMGDYANTVYILALDKKHAAKAINRLHGEGGKDYLEKIIQLPFKIPKISKQDLESILFDRLKKLLVIVPKDSWNKNYWADIYYSSLKYFFENFRDITHYVNTLGFGFPWVKDVVNPVDFFAITAIEVFEPKVYCGIRDNKDLFTDLVDNIYEFDAKKLAEDKSRCDEILSRAKHISESLLQQLLIRLFPRLRGMYQQTISFYHLEAIARKNKRICSFDVFDIYFRLAIPDGFISKAEMHALLALIPDEEGFALALLRLNQDNRILHFLDLLDSVSHSISAKDAPHVINALIDSADLFPEGDESIIGLNTTMRIHRIIHQLLSHFPSNTERCAIFMDAIQKTDKSLYSITHEIKEQEKEHTDNTDATIPIEYRTFSPDQLVTLQKLAVTKINEWVNIGRLIEHPKLLPILYAWKSWGEELECRRYIEKITQDDRGLLSFLIATLKIPIEQTITKLKPNPDWKKYLQHVNDFIPSDTLIDHAKSMFEDNAFIKLREKEQVALLVFLSLTRPDTVKIIPKTSD